MLTTAKHAAAPNAAGCLSTRRSARSEARWSAYPAVAAVMLSGGVRGGGPRSRHERQCQHRREFASRRAPRGVGSAGRTLAGILITITGSRYPVVFAVACALSALPLGVAVRGLRADLPAPIASDAGGAGTSTGPRPPIGPYIGLGVLVSGTAYT